MLCHRPCNCNVAYIICFIVSVQKHGQANIIDDVSFGLSNVSPEIIF